MAFEPPDQFYPSARSGDRLAKPPIDMPAGQRMASSSPSSSSRPFPSKFSPSLFEREGDEEDLEDELEEPSDLDPTRRGSTTTTDSLIEPISPPIEFGHQDALADRPTIVRSSDSDPTGEDRQDQPVAASKGMVSHSRQKIESGIGNIAAKLRSFGFPGSGGAKSGGLGTAEENGIASSLSHVNHSTTASRSASSSTSSTSPTASTSSYPSKSTLTVSPNRPSHSVSPSQSYPHSPRSAYNDQAQTHYETDITPRAEFPPPYRAPNTYPVKSPGDADDEDETVGSASRNGTIKRKRDHTIRKSVLPSVNVSGSEQEQPPPSSASRKEQDRGSIGYFPDVEELKRKAKQQRDAEKAKRKSDALARRARAAALATFNTSPRSAATATFPGMGESGVEMLRRSSTGSTESHASFSDDSGTDEVDTPWPSSARHGDTPLGLEHVGAKVTKDGIRTRLNSLDSIEEAYRHSARSRGSSFDHRSVIEVEEDEEEQILNADTGCAISIPLSPPPGYPLSSPCLSSDSIWTRSSSNAGSAPPSDSESTGQMAQLDGALHAMSINKSTSPYGHYSKPTAVAAHDMSRSSSLSGNNLHADLQKFGQRRPMATANSSSSGLASDSSDRFQGPNIEPVAPGTLPFEGKITIDTSAHRYLISAEMAGFTLDNITIAIKSINRAGSSKSRPSSGDASSIHSARSNASGQRLMPRTGSPDVLSEGKVLHLIADRWEDSAHFERRITFGQDADFTNGVKAKFDGKKLVIEVTRRARRARRPPARITGGPVSLSSDGPLARYPLNRPASSSDAMGAEHALPTKRNHSIAF